MWKNKTYYYSDLLKFNFLTKTYYYSDLLKFNFLIKTYYYVHLLSQLNNEGTFPGISLSSWQYISCHLF